MKVRQSNYELMRIVSMFLIVIYHILIHGNVFNNTKGGLHFIFAFLICITLVHVNSFVLVTGYFNYNKDFKWKKFFSVFMQSWFYQIVIALIIFICGIYYIGGSYTLFNTLSPLNYSYWFIVKYLLLYLLSPYINKVIKCTTQKEHKRLIIIMFILFSILPFITRGGLIFNDGFTLIQFIMLYFIGAYFRKYPIQENYHFKRFSKNKLQIILFSLTIIFCLSHFLLNLLSSYFLSFENQIFVDFGNSLKQWFTYYSAPFVILQSVCYFLWFGTLSIKNKAINLIASLVFGVYLIHDNDFVRPILYKFLKIDTGTVITDFIIIFKVFGFAILIFVICLLIEFIRKKSFEFICKRKLVKKLTFKIKNYLINV